MITREWWIEDAFTVTECDGDIGDLHHECVVLIRACSELVDEIRERTEWDIGEDYDGDFHWLYSDILDSSDAAGVDDPEEFLASKGMDRKVWSRALDSKQDHRIVGMRDYGWSAVRADRIDTWSLNRKKIKQIASGLLEIADAEGIYIDDDEFTIEDFSTRKLFRATPRQMMTGCVSPYISSQPVSSL